MASMHSIISIIIIGGLFISFLQTIFCDEQRQQTTQTVTFEKNPNISDRITENSIIVIKQQRQQPLFTKKKKNKLVHHQRRHQHLKRKRLSQQRLTETFHNGPVNDDDGGDTTIKFLKKNHPKTLRSSVTSGRRSFVSSHNSIRHHHHHHHHRFPVSEQFRNDSTPEWIFNGSDEQEMAAAAAQAEHQRKRQHRNRHGGRNRNNADDSVTFRKPNIIFILTDDQDIELGSMNYMPKTMKIMAEDGVTIRNAYSTTPMCCPSRSSILTGLYVHNHNVYTNGENCSSIQWQSTHERKTFATYLNNIGYRTAYFGKYLNEYNGSYIPPGWSDWSALIRNSRYYNYTLNVNGAKIRHGYNYSLDYYPDLILNDSLHYLRYSKRLFPGKPYLMVLSFPSPHGPEDSAPQFQHLFLGEKRHRTASWNHAPNGDKQWLLRNTPKMSAIHQDFTDFLYAKRLQTLQTIDDAVFKIYTELKNLNELDNTYLVYTSDHGYHLGQFGLVKGKAMPFEFDIRVPFFVRGPNVPSGKILPQIVLNIDIAPTLLDMAGIPIPAHMDGISFLPFVKQLADGTKPDRTNRIQRNRDSFLVERGKFKTPTNNKVDQLLLPIIGKRQWLQLQCSKPEYRGPCRPGQRFECIEMDDGLPRIRKCPTVFVVDHGCICPRDDDDDDDDDDGDDDNNNDYADGNDDPPKLRLLKKNKKKKNNNNKFRSGNRLKKKYASDWHQQQSSTSVQQKPMAERRHRRSGRSRSLTPYDTGAVAAVADEPDYFDVEEVYNLKRMIDISKSSSLASTTTTTTTKIGAGTTSFEWPSNSNHDHNNNQSTTTTATTIRANQQQNSNNLANITTSQLVSILSNSDDDEKFSEMANYTDYLNRTFCTVLRSNLSIECSSDIYSDQDVWIEKKDFINMAIIKLQKRLFELKGIRRYINENRPQRKSNQTIRMIGGQNGRERCLCRKNHYRNNRRFRSGGLNNWKRWLRRRQKKNRRREKFQNTECKIAAGEQMNCFTHDNDHWKTPPLWTNGPFCFCQNSLNSSFWCMRTINETNNSLYCEFITGFLTYYDLDRDPYQMRNAINDLDFNVITELSKRLDRLKSCSGSVDCSGFTTPSSMAPPTASQRKHVFG